MASSTFKMSKPLAFKLSKSGNSVRGRLSTELRVGTNQRLLLSSLTYAGSLLTSSVHPHRITRAGLGPYSSPTMLHATWLQTSAGQTPGGKARPVSPSPVPLWHKPTPSLYSTARLEQTGPGNAEQKFKV